MSEHNPCTYRGVGVTQCDAGQSDVLPDAQVAGRTLVDLDLDLGASGGAHGDAVGRDARSHVVDSKHGQSVERVASEELHSVRARYVLEEK